MNERDRTRLLHLHLAITDINEAVEGKTFEDFMSAKILRKAVERDLITIGEAISHLSDEVKESHPDWQKIKALRNLIIHEYFSVDPMEVWDIVETKLADLEKWVASTLKS